MASADATLQRDEATERNRRVWELRALSSSRWISQAIYAATDLGIADALGDHCLTARKLADVTNTEARSLTRLLRALSTLDLVTREGADRWRLTGLGRLLRSDAVDSVASSVRLTIGPSSWRAWGAFSDCIRTGATAAQLLDGIEDPFDVFDTPEARATFDRAMADGTRRIADAVVDSYDVAVLRHVVDVGGGYGSLVMPMLRANPEMTATVFDRDRCADGAAELARSVGLADRCRFVAGDWFEDPIPPGADAYLLKSVLHDWGDERSLEILAACQRATGDGSRLLVIEVVVPDALGTSAVDRMIVAADLNMLVSTGGRERTEAEYRELLDRASFRVTRIVPTASGLSVIEAVPV